MIRPALVPNRSISRQRFFYPTKFGNRGKEINGSQK
jgi:hypothetical protein